MASASGIRSVVALPRPKRDGRASLSALFAHDVTLGGCRPLLDRLSESVELAGAALTVASSTQDAAEQLRLARARVVAFDVAIVGLDLQPAPLAGVRMAEFALRLHVPVVLVTRSLRWLPIEAAGLRVLPWLSPDADVAAIDAAVAEALDHPMTGVREDDADDRVSIGF
jgi:hypothetical protein